MPRPTGPHSVGRCEAVAYTLSPAANVAMERSVLKVFKRKCVMAKLPTSKKKAEPNREFGLPEQRKYPMPDASHARNAKARASQMEHRGKLSASEKKKIDAKADKELGK